MTPDPVIERIIAAVGLFNTGRRAEAREAFNTIWSEIEADGAPFHQCVFSHYFADVQDDLKDELMWDRRALAAADRAVKESAGPEASLSVLSFYPSLHLNLADVLHRTGDIETARKHLAAAEAGIDALKDDPYGQMIRAGLERLTRRLA
jgi:hypothetical protein